MFARFLLLVVVALQSLRRLKEVSEAEAFGLDVVPHFRELPCAEKIVHLAVNAFIELLSLAGTRIAGLAPPIFLLGEGQFR
ncbi:MAG TPA: hypothetical protein VFO14_01110 [Vicinamibacterales bacterium]|nr:hypothetical protein [Vicinamibacterales bacterium]